MYFYANHITRFSTNLSSHTKLPAADVYIYTIQQKQTFRTLSKLIGKLSSFHLELELIGSFVMYVNTALYISLLGNSFDG